uniref:Uncharacterized protein n=1 Tax=Ascaris lumbricoides TaxID=6252 RepID=A0A9J2PTW4_ASCLU
MQTQYPILGDILQPDLLAREVVKSTYRQLIGGHNSASEMYRMAMEQLQSAAKQASNAAAYFLTSGQEYAQETQQGAYEIYKIAKSKLQSAAEQAYDAAGKLIENGQSYVEEARRRSADVYNEALARLNSAAEEAKVIAEEVFEGREAADNGPWEIHDQLQDAYERVTDAAAKGLEKAYETFTELGKEAFQTVTDRRPGARGGKAFDSDVDSANNANNAPDNDRGQASEKALEEMLTPAEGSKQGQLGDKEQLATPSGLCSRSLMTSSQNTNVKRSRELETERYQRVWG